MPRDRALTEQRLIDAVGQIIAEQGLDQAGINRVANRAGVNKILIYRYFGGMEGLMEAYIRRARPVVSVPSLDVNALREAPLEDILAACAEYIISEYRLLRSNVEAQEFLKADLLRQDDINNPIAAEKERQFLKMIDELATIVETPYARAFAALITSAMTLLTFLGQNNRTVLDIPLGDEKSWQQLEEALRRIFRGAYLLLNEEQERVRQATANSDGRVA